MFNYSASASVSTTFVLKVGNPVSVSTPTTTTSQDPFMAVASKCLAPIFTISAFSKTRNFENCKNSSGKARKDRYSNAESLAKWDSSMLRYQISLRSVTKKGKENRITAATITLVPLKSSATLLPYHQH